MKIGASDTASYEVCASESDERCDCPLAHFHVVQVGCLAFELVAGRAPFQFSTAEQTATAILYGSITEWPDCFRAYSISFIKSCLQKVRSSHRMWHQPGQRNMHCRLGQHFFLLAPTRGVTKRNIMQVPERRATITELLQHPVIGTRKGLSAWFNAVNAVTATKAFHALGSPFRKPDRN